MTACCCPLLLRISPTLLWGCGGQGETWPTSLACLVLKAAKLMAVDTCRDATAALVQGCAKGRVTPTGIWRHLKMQISHSLDTGLRLQVPESWAKIWAAPAPLPGHNHSPLLADLPPRCCGHGCCPMHGAGHRGAQQAGLLSRCGHSLSPLCGNRQPTHIRDWRVSVDYSPSAVVCGCPQAGGFPTS